MLKSIRNRGREISTTSVSIEILRTFERLGEEALKNKRLLDPVCRDNPSPWRARLKEINLLFRNGYTQQRSLGSSNLLLVEILKISSEISKLCLQIVLVCFTLELSLSFLASPLFSLVQSFLAPPSLILEADNNSGMVSLLRGSYNLLHNLGSLGLFTFSQLFTKYFSLPAWGTLEICFFGKSSFINGSTFVKSWILKSFGLVNTNGFVLTSTLKCPWEWLPPTPWTAFQGTPLKGLFLSKARKVLCGPVVYSHGLGNIACFCSLLL